MNALATLGPHLVWGLVALAVAWLAARALRSPQTRTRELEAMVAAHELELGKRSDVADRLERLEQRVVQLDLRTKPVPKVR